VQKVLADLVPGGTDILGHEAVRHGVPFGYEHEAGLETIVAAGLLVGLLHTRYPAVGEQAEAVASRTPCRGARMSNRRVNIVVSNPLAPVGTHDVGTDSHDQPNYPVA
jgi:hypothetical protein